MWGGSQASPTGPPSRLPPTSGPPSSPSPSSFQPTSPASSSLSVHGESYVHHHRRPPPLLQEATYSLPNPSTPLSPSFPAATLPPFLSRFLCFLLPQAYAHAAVITASHGAAAANHLQSGLLVLKVSPRFPLPIPHGNAAVPVVLNSPSSSSTPASTSGRAHVDDELVAIRPPLPRPSHQEIRSDLLHLRRQARKPEELRRTGNAAVYFNAGRRSPSSSPTSTWRRRPHQAKPLRQKSVVSSRTSLFPSRPCFHLVPSLPRVVTVGRHDREHALVL